MSSCDELEGTASSGGREIGRTPSDARVPRAVANVTESLHIRIGECQVNVVCDNDKAPSEDCVKGGVGFRSDFRDRCRRKYKNF